MGMHERFIVITKDKYEIWNMNYKWIDYPYMSYYYHLGDEKMMPLEEINDSMWSVPKLENSVFVFYPCIEVIICLSNLVSYLLRYSDELLKDANWNRKTIDTPINTAYEIQELITELNQYPNTTEIAIIRLSEY
mgnify:CR=1 FL=1|tara:strand:+ start:5826 stop:6227 length:402 start_codon:yes stop_codon:yes gene_type:complete